MNKKSLWARACGWAAGWKGGKETPSPQLAYVAGWRAAVREMRKGGPLPTIRKAPWKDFAGSDIYEGDIIAHPSAEQGTVVFCADETEAVDQWRVIYRDGNTRLVLQIGDKGQATVLRSTIKG
jgi:hypothetical protein